MFSSGFASCGGCGVNGCLGGWQSCLLSSCAVLKSCQVQNKFLQVHFVGLDVAVILILFECMLLEFFRGNHTMILGSCFVFFAHSAASGVNIAAVTSQPNQLWISESNTRNHPSLPACNPLWGKVQCHQGRRLAAESLAAASSFFWSLSGTTREQQQKVPGQRDLQHTAPHPEQACFWAHSRLPWGPKSRILEFFFWIFTSWLFWQVSGWLGNIASEIFLMLSAWAQGWGGCLVSFHGGNLTLPRDCSSPTKFCLTLSG